MEDHFEVVEMGTPFARYSLFEDFTTDYLVAFPTDLSFVTPMQKAVFLRNVNRLLAEIPPDTAVTLKLHNVSDGGRLIERASRGFRLGSRLSASMRAGGIGSSRMATFAPLTRCPGRRGSGTRSS